MAADGLNACHGLPESRPPRQVDHTWIANVDCVAQFPSSISLRRTEPAYAEFTTHATGSSHEAERRGSIALDVECCCDIVDRVPRIRPGFESGQSWTFYERRGESCLVLHSPKSDSPLWVIKSGDAFETGVAATARVLSAGEESVPTCVPHPFVYPVDQILLMHRLAAMGGAILHGAAVVIDGGVYLMLGRSGAGKSTLSSLLDGAGAGDILSDDRVIVRRQGGSTTMAYGTPWPGTGGFARNAGFPLHGLCFLRQSHSCSVSPLSRTEALERLLQVVSIPWYERTAADAVLDSCDRLITHFPSVDLFFTRDDRAVDAMINVAGQ